MVDPSSRMRAPLPPGARIGDGEVLDCVEATEVGFVYRVIESRGALPQLLHEYLPRPLSTRKFGVVVPHPDCADPFERGLRRFVADFRFAATSPHPAMLPVKRVWLQSGTAYAQMPVPLGRALELHWADLSFKATPGLLESWLRALADVLDPVHRTHGCHGGIDPLRLWIGIDGRLCVRPPDTVRWELSGNPRGTSDPYSPWVAPELMRPERRPQALRPSADIYSIAAIAHTLVFGAPPLSAVDRSLDDVLAPGRVPVPAGWPPRLVQGICAGLALDPNARASTLVGFLASLGFGDRRARRRRAAESVWNFVFGSPAASQAAPAQPVDSSPPDTGSSGLSDFGADSTLGPGTAAVRSARPGAEGAVIPTLLRGGRVDQLMDMIRPRP